MGKKGTSDVSTKPLNRSLSAAKAARIALKGDPDKYPGGESRSADCVELLKQADIVVTNPPFSSMTGRVFLLLYT